MWSIRTASKFSLCEPLPNGPVRPTSDAHQTTDGRIWNIVEQRASADLIHDNALLGRKVEGRARFFRRAGAIEMESYRVEGRAANLADRPGEPRQVLAKLEPVH